MGRSHVEFKKADQRFADPTWRENPAYRRLGQSYRAWEDAMQRLVDRADVDDATAARARLAATILTSAAAPTNTVLGNPAVLKRAFETGGRSLMRGARNLVRDLRANGGMPSQVDRRPFKVGENLAATPGSVVFRNEVCEVMQYTPTTEQVRERPVLMIPPQINKYYFMDLAPGRSFIEYAISRGLQFFCISWRNPTGEQRDWDLDTYAMSCIEAMDVAREITGSPHISVLGLCAGGITSSTVLSHLAGGDDRVSAASFAVTLLDFSQRALIDAFQSQRLISLATWNSRRAGVLDGEALGRIFAWLRPNDLVFNYLVNDWLMGNDPPAFDILAWNSDSTRLPAALHEQFLRLFEHNLLRTPGALTVLGTPVDLSRVKCDAFVTGALTDHLTPWASCYQTTQMLGGDSEFVLSSSGHIQSLVNPPGNPKMQYFTGPPPGPDPEAWRAKAEPHPGSWWERWADWTIERSGADRPAPRELGSKKHPAGDPAPGRYVHQK
jgi:polyhydroxyalkanoate synthase